MTTLRSRFRLRRLLAPVGLVLAGVVAGLYLSAALLHSGSGSGLGADSARSAVDFSPVKAQARGLPRGTSVVAAARGGELAVFAHPRDRRPERRLDERSVNGHPVPLVTLVRRRHGDWLQVYLPTRPNLSTGWVRARDVRLRADPYRLQVQLRAHRLILWRDARPILRTPIGVGRAVSPTPTGRYFITDLVRPPDPRGFYGPYAFGLSAHSRIFTTFEGGDGQIGIHGTDAPTGLGRDVSHGCIRVADARIVRLARTLPLGTPVDISR